MQNIRSKNTSIEKKIRSELHKKGFRFRIHYSKLPGNPDIVFVNSKIVIFIDSCFWHCCPKHFIKPKSNLHYWEPKFERNKNRDKFVNSEIRKLGWRILRFWEHEVRKDSGKIIEKITKELSQNR